GAVFDALVPQLASELELPGRRAERADVRDRAVRSLGELFTGAARAGLRITGTETRFSVPLTLALAGGERTVHCVGSHNRDAVDAIQLASYAWALAQEDPSAAPADVGYFLLRSGEFISADPALDPHRRTPMDVDEAWRRMREAITATLDEVASGTVRVGCREL